MKILKNTCNVDMSFVKHVEGSFSIWIGIFAWFLFIYAYKLNILFQYKCYMYYRMRRHRF